MWSAFWFIDGTFLAVISHGERGNGAFLGHTRALTPFIHKDSILPKAPPPNHLGGLGFNMNSKGTQIFKP